MPVSNLFADYVRISVDERSYKRAWQKHRVRGRVNEVFEPPSRREKSLRNLKQIFDWKLEVMKDLNEDNGSCQFLLALIWILIRMVCTVWRLFLTKYSVKRHKINNWKVYQLSKNLVLFITLISKSPNFSHHFLKHWQHFLRYFILFIVCLFFRITFTQTFCDLSRPSHFLWHNTVHMSELPAIQRSFRKHYDVTLEHLRSRSDKTINWKRSEIILISTSQNVLQ